LKKAELALRKAVLGLKNLVLELRRAALELRKAVLVSKNQEPAYDELHLLAHSSRLAF